jgi:copper chaperone NosL
VLKWTFLGVLFLLGCQRSNLGIWQPGEFGCTQCQMNIVDLRFKTAAMTHKGKIFPFDSIECLFSWKKDHRADIKNTFLTDFNQPNSWILTSRAFILKSERRPSPMGGFLSAYSSQNEFEKAQQSVGGVRVFFK